MGSLPQGFAMVRCGEATHRVGVKDGRIILYDHPNLTTDLVLAALTGNTPVCIKLFQMWRLGRLGHEVPPELHAAFAARLAKTRERRRGRQG